MLSTNQIFSDANLNQIQLSSCIVMLQDIEELITEIQVARQKSRDTNSQSSSETGRYRKKWTLTEENLLYDLIVRYGTDFALIEEYFPLKTRKQIKKKYKEISESKLRKLQKMESEFHKERRKSFFDQEVLQDNIELKVEKMSVSNLMQVQHLDEQPQSFL